MLTIMMKTTRAFLAAALLSAAGCGAPEEEIVDDFSMEVEDGDAKADGISAPSGTYRNADSQGDVALLVLKTDRTFHFEGQCPAGTNCFYVPVYDGTYKFTRSGSYRYVRLTHGTAETRLAYRFGEGGALELRQVGTRQWMTFTQPRVGWCAVPNDCRVQYLAVPRCLGEATCTANACGFTCK